MHFQTVLFSDSTHQDLLARLPPPERVFGRHPRLVLDVRPQGVHRRRDGPPDTADSDPIAAAARGSHRLHQRQGAAHSPGNYGEERTVQNPNGTSAAMDG